jgi:WXG100 family type VII secretion target
MSNDVIQAKYELLEKIAARFGNESDVVGEMNGRVQQAMRSLQDGGWEGEGSQAFFAEMEDMIFPISARLLEALAQAQSVTLQIKEILQAAEEEAARPFGGAADGGGRSDGAGIVGGTAVNNTPVSNKLSKDLVVRDPKKEIFTEEYMENMIGSDFQGANSPRLNQLMEQLLQANRTGNGNEAQVSDLLNQIADIRGADRAIFRDQYKVFQNLWDNAATKGDIDLNQHGDFMGSTVSLRYGSVVGDVFGIDPVFGAVLNPTGGLVGPASTSYQPHPNDAIGYHGVFHDAGGYLYNEQGQIGPGYNYLDREPFPTDFPGTGQVGGISWWASHPQLNIDIPANNMPDIPYVPEFLEPAVGIAAEGFLNTVRPITYGVEGGLKIADGIGDIFQGGFSEGAGDILDGSTTVIGGTVRTGAEQLIGRNTVNGIVNFATSIFD